jgi:hypothetical protein
MLKYFILSSRFLPDEPF